MTEHIKIGEWRFEPAQAVLSRASKRVHLENRAAEVLALLCRRHGEIVSHKEFIDEVWQGRAVSPNSVAVVIRDIRRAFGDDARKPRYVETVSKRGYRIAESVAFANGVTGNGALPESAVAELGYSQKTGKRWLVPGVAAAATLMVATFILWPQISNSARSDRVAIAVGDFVNDTGDAAYAPLSPAMSELVKTELMRYNQIHVATRPGTDIVVRGNMIIWDGRVAVALHAEDKISGELIWSGMASGPESELPSQVRREFVKLAEVLTAE